MFGNIKNSFSLFNISSRMYTSVVLSVVPQLELIEFCPTTLHPFEHRVEP